MTPRPFRFVQSSDFHLERPPFGITETPQSLQELFLEAPYLAAERVFETALAEQVDFVVLAGDLLQAETTGPRGPLFLISQFERLRQRGIDVYWAGSQLDSLESWPAAFRLPDNVHLFSAARPDEFVHQRDGEPLVRLTGLSRQRGKRIRPGDFWPDASGLFSIAVANGNIDSAALATRGIAYWALGGRHGRETPVNTACTVHYAGTPQGRQPSEAGTHGCTVVHVDAEGRPHARFAATDVLRWRDEHIAFDASTTRDDLQRMLRDRMGSLVAASAGLDLLVSWTLGGTGPLAAALRRGTLSTELLGMLRDEFGRASPAAWSLTLTAEPGTGVPPAYYEQDTILGDFMRAVRALESQPAATGAKGTEVSLDLATLLGQQHMAGPLAAAAVLDDTPIRRRVLRNVAALGADLLSGEDSQS
jgi:hypothetical protein